MRILPLLPPAASLVAGPAAAHPGHLGTLGGHDHWALGVGIGVIVAGAVAGWLKGRKTEPETDAPEEDETEDQPT